MNNRARRLRMAHLDLVWDRFIPVPDEGPTTDPPLRDRGDDLLLGTEVVARRFRFPQPGKDGRSQGVLWVKVETAAEACHDPWNGPLVQILAWERGFLVAPSFAAPSTIEEAMRIHDMEEGAETLKAELSDTGWVPLSPRLQRTEFDIEINELFDDLSGERPKTLDKDVARALMDSPLAVAPFAEEKATRYEPGSSERPEARVEGDMWLSPEGSRLAFAAADLSSREGIPVLDAVRRIVRERDRR